MDQSSSRAVRARPWGDHGSQGRMASSGRALGAGRLLRAMVCPRRCSDTFIGLPGTRSGGTPRMDCGESWSRGECKNAVSQAAHGHAANRHGASVAQAVASLAQVGRQYGSIAQVPGPHPGCRYATMPAVLPVHEETPKCKVGVSMSRPGSAPFSRNGEETMGHSASDIADTSTPVLAPRTIRL